MAGRSISTKVSIEGEKQYRSAITSINAVLKELKSEMQLVTAQFQGNANSQEALAAKGAVLKKQLSEQQSLIKTLTAAIQSGKKAQDDWRSAIETTKISLATVNEKLASMDSSTQASGQQWLALKNKMEAARAELASLKSSTGDTTAEQERLTAQIQELEAEMKALDDATGGSASEVGKLYEEQAKLSTTLETQEGKLQGVTDKTTRWQTQLNKAAAEVVALSEEERKNNQYMEEAQKAADGCATSIDKYGKEVKEAGQNSSGAASGIDETNKALDAMAALLVTAGIQSALQKMVSALKACVDTSAEFNYTMATVQATSGATEDEIEKLNVQALEYASTTIFLAKDVAESYQAMAQAGWSVDDMLDSMSGVMNLAAASAEDLGDVTNIVVDAMTAFGYSASEAGNFADVLAEAAADSNTSVALLGESFTAVSSTAGAMGYTIEDVAVALAALANNGIKSEMAGTALATSLTRMSGSNETAMKAMEELGLTMVDTETGAARPLQECLDEMREAFSGLTDEQKINYAYQLAGQKGMKALLAIVNTADETWDSLTESINNCNGAAEDMANIQLDTYTGQVQLLESAMEGLKMEVGNQLTPALGELTEGLTAVLNGVTGFISGNKEAVPIVTGTAVALGTFTAAVTVATTAVKVFQLAQEALGASFGPVGLAAAAISAVLGVLAYDLIETKNTATEADNVLSSCSNSAKEWAETQNTLATSSSNTLALMQSLISLSTQTNKSSADIEVMKATVDELNGSVEGLNLSYDEQTDTLSMTTEALEAYVNMMVKQQQAQAIVERMIELKTEEAELEEQLAAAKENTAAAQQEYLDTIDEYTNGYEGVSSGVLAAQQAEDELNEALSANNEAYAELEGQYSEIIGQVDEYSSLVGDTTENTEDLTEANETASESMEALAEMTESLTETCGYYIERLAEAGISVDQLSQYLIDSGQSAEDWKKSIDDAVNTIVNDFELLEADTETSIYTMGENLQSNIDAYTAWQTNISTLMAAAKASGNDTSVAFVQYMADMGVGSAAQVQQMVDDMNYTFGTLAPTWGAAVDAATAACASGIETGGAEASAAVEEVAQEGVDAITGAGTDDAGKRYTEKMAEGVSGQKGKVETAVKGVGDAGAKAFGNVDTKSAGSRFTSGLAQGITSGSGKVTTSATSLATNAKSPFYNQNWSSVGYNISSGIASGIRSGSSVVTNAAKSVAQSAYNSAKNTLSIHSPSKVMAEVGQFYDEGFAQGITENTNKVIAAVNDMTGASISEASGTIDATGGTIITNNYGGSDSGTYSMLAKYLPKLLSALESDSGGVSLKGLAKAITPYVDGNLGTTEKRRARGN